jgi:hypothetical protein
MSYAIGHRENGYEWNGATWIPVPAAPAPPPPPPAASAPPPPPPPNPHAMGQGLPPPPAPAGYAPPPAPYAAPAAPVQYGAPAVAAPQGQPGRMKTGKLRFSYLFVNPRDNKGKQRVTLLFPKAPGVYEQLCAKRDEAIRAKIKGDWPQYYRDPIKDGDTYKNPTNQKPLGEECRGHWVINAVAHGAQNVEIFDEYGNQILAPGAVKSGDWGRASITFYYSTKDNNLGVNVSLNSLIFMERGEPLSSSAISAEDEFAGEFRQAPAGYQPPGAGYQPQLAAPAGYTAPPPQQAAGFAPPPAAPGAAAAPQPMIYSQEHGAWIPNPALQPQPPAAPPAPPPMPVTPPGPPPGAIIQNNHWWNAQANQWVPL